MQEARRAAPAPPKKASASRETITLPADSFVPPLAIGFGIAARTRGQHWAATPEELAALSASLAAVFVHIPLPSKELAVFVAVQNLAVTIGGVLQPRIKRDIEIAQEQEALRQAQGIVNRGQGIG